MQLQEDQKNLVLAIVLSVVILFGFEFIYGFFAPPPPPVQETAPQTQTSPQATGTGPAVTPGAPNPDAPPVPGGATTVPAVGADRDAALASGTRIKVTSPRLTGSIALNGGRIDDLTLTDYRVSLEPDSEQIVLFSPNLYYADFGWLAADPGMPVPGLQAKWRADGTELTPEKPVTLSWTNDRGLTFSRTIALDANYMFTVTQQVRNDGGDPVDLYGYGLISRYELPEITGFYILHEGPYGVFDGTLKEIDYDDLMEDEQEAQSATGGWIGITDKYWLATLIADQSQKVDSRFSYTTVNGTDKFQVDMKSGLLSVPAGGSVALETHLFAGAKEVSLLEGYGEALGIDRFDLAIDWGYLYFLTKPIFHGIEYFNDLLGNFGLAILLLTVIIKLIFFPLANKSYRAMTKMKKLQPEMVELKERYSDDKQRMQKELMELYKKEKVNPMSGCLPILVQIPVFFALYKVLFVTIEMRHAPFYGWVQDLSAPDPTSLLNLFGLIPYSLPEPMLIGIWPIIMGATMWLQQKLNPPPADPTQAKVMMFLPFFFTLLLARFPAGLVIYWTWNNVLSIAQQWVIMHKAGVKIGGGT